MKKLITLSMLLSGLNYSLYAQNSVSIYKTFALKQANKTIANTSFQQLPNMVYDYQGHLAPACKAELYLEKTTKLPLRFRIGSIEQSNYLEQKPNSNLYNK